MVCCMQTTDLHGDGKVNTGVTTKLSKIKLCNRIVRRMKKIIFTGILEWFLFVHNFSMI